MRGEDTVAELGSHHTPRERIVIHKIRILFLRNSFTYSVGTLFLLIIPWFSAPTAYVPVFQTSSGVSLSEADWERNVELASPLSPHLLDALLADGPQIN